MPLEQVTDGNHHYGCDNLCEDCIDVQVFYQNFKEEIIDKQVRNKNKKIPDQLYTPTDGGIYEHHIFIEQEAHWKCNKKGKNQGSNVWLECIEPKVDHFFPEHKLVTVRVQKETQHHIRASASSIPEGLQWHQLFKGLIKKIDYSGNLVMNHDSFLAGAKIIIATHSFTQIVKSLTNH